MPQGSPKLQTEGNAVNLLKNQKLPSMILQIKRSIEKQCAVLIWQENLMELVIVLASSVRGLEG